MMQYYDEGPICPNCGGDMRRTPFWGDVCDDCEEEMEAREAALAEQESKYGEDGDIERALVEDGEKLRQLTGEDHGPFFPPEDPEDC